MIDVDAVTMLLREAADRAILPRFRRLRTDEVVEKTPGELVTAADREAEDILAASLPRLLTGSRVVGEEGCASRPELLRNLDEGLVWLLDPLDGTANFAAGRPPFAVMLALLQEGAPIASWMVDPLSGDAWTAENGSGAWRSGRRVCVDRSVPLPEEMRGALISHFMSVDMQARIRSRFSSATQLPKLMCSGAEYPAIACGERDVSLFWRTLPWDHAPGALFLTEAGGHVCRFDGSPYRPTTEGEGLIVARNREIADNMVLVLAD